jgi:hypothetical protein
MLVSIRNSPGGFYVVGPDLSTTRHIKGAQGPLAILQWPSSVFSVPYPSLVQGERKLRPYTIRSFASEAGQVIDSFGSADEGGATAAKGGGAWVWTAAPYVLTRHSAKGEPIQSLTRRVPGFPQTWTQVIPGREPPPSLQDVQQDAAGRLWVAMNVASPTWLTGFAGGSFRPDKLYQTTIEILDPATGRMVTSAKLNGWVKALLQGGKAAIYEVTEQGAGVRIVQLTVVQ